MDGITLLPATVSTERLLQVWSELVEAYYGLNRFGGHVAEIYAYMLHPYTPTVHGAGKDAAPQRAQALNRTAAQALASICAVFMQHYDCTITIDGLAVQDWVDDAGHHFGHRVHVAVERLA